jgi:post-segregation antitoxin (ccd killing protein)
VKLVDEIEIPELTTEQIETLCTTAEDAARKHILAKVSSRMVERLDISVEAEGAKPLNLTVEVELALSPQANDIDADALADEAVKEALAASEKYLRKLK